MHAPEKHDDYEIAQLKPYDANAKIHTDAQISAIAESIKQFGFQQPIVVDENNEIIIGHGRYLAATLLQMARVPVWVVKTYTDAEKRALRIVDNKLNSLTGYDKETLDRELSQLVGMIDFEPLALDYVPPDFATRNGGSGTTSGKIEYLVLIECADETQQKIVFDECNAKGWSCKLIE